MKRFVAGIVVGVLITLAGAAVAAPGTIKLIVNGQELPCQPAPRLIDGSVFVPVRFVSEALGAQVSWDQGRNAVVIIAGGATTSPGPEWISARDLTNQYGVAVAAGGENHILRLMKHGKSIEFSIAGRDGVRTGYFNGQTVTMLMKSGRAYFNANQLKDAGFIP